MRIALFASLLGLDATGQSAVVVRTATKLAAAGAQVTVLATDCGVGGGPIPKYVTFPPEVKVLVFPSVGKLNRRLFRSPALIAWLRQHVDEFDVLDVQGTWGIGGLEAAKVFDQRNKPYLITPHGTMTKYDWKKGTLRRNILFALFLGKVWRKADAIHFTSSGERDTSYYPATGPAPVVPNAIDLLPPPTPETKLAARAKLGIPADAAMLVFLGRIVHQKGVKEIVAAFEIAADRIPALILYLVGPPDGEYGVEVLDLVKLSRHKDRIFAPGAIFGDAKYDYLRAANAFITLSHNEGMSIAHLEALAEGLPMILTESSNLDFLEEYGAGVITTHDAATAAAAIVRMMSSPEARAQASSQARRLVEEKFTWAIVAPQMLDLYQRLIDKRSSSGRGSK